MANKIFREAIAVTAALAFSISTEKFMNLHLLMQYGFWILQSVQTNFGWKQICDVADCQNATRAQFTVASQSHQATLNVCSNCAAALTDHSVSRFNMAETYINTVRPQFKSLRQLNAMQIVSNHPNKNVKGRLNISIGDQHIFITSFQGGGYMLIVNGQPKSPNLNKSIKGKKRLTDFTQNIVNNRYKDRLLNHILHGTPFIMP